MTRINNMISYAICEISGKQFKVIPNQPVLVDLIDESIKNIDVNVLMLLDNGKIKLGNPYLREKLTLDLVENVSNKKIRVSKYHSKANSRRVQGIRIRRTKAIWPVKKT